MSERRDEQRNGEAVPGRAVALTAAPETVIRPALQRARAAFVSQLIAERLHLPPQRERRRESAATAVDSYAHTAEGAVRRLPPGYRKSLLA